MSSTSVDLKQAVADQDLYTVQCFVTDQQGLILKGWFDHIHQNFSSILQLSLQKSHRMKRQLVAAKDEIPYQLGVWEGWLQAFRVLYNEESKINNILEMTIAKSPNSAKIIRFLYQHEQSISHGELAAALGMTYSALTNAMKRVIACGAVSASRIGRNTRYTLTPTAKQYCQREIKWDNVLPKSRELVLLEELLKIYQSKPSKEIASVSLGESLRISEGPGKELSERKHLKGIIQIGTEKILELEPDDSDIPFLKEPNPEFKQYDFALSKMDFVGGSAYE